MQVNIYLINLNRNIDRLHYFQKQANEHKIKFTRIAAIDGKDLTSCESISNYSELSNRKNYHKQLNRGEIACYLSHRKAWEQFLSTTGEMALIFEDDVKLNSDLFEVVEEAKKFLTLFDLIKLNEGARPKKILSKLKLTSDYYITLPQKLPMTNMAQLITRKGAKKLLRMSEEFSRPLDVDIQRIWENQLDAFSIYPSLIINKKWKSEINKFGNRNQQYFNIFLKLKLKLKFEFHLRQYMKGYKGFDALKRIANI